MGARQIRAGVLLVGALIFLVGSPALAEPFKFFRIGDKDGFGFRDTKPLKRAYGYTGQQGPADDNGDGVLGPAEFLPDLDQDGVVRVRSGDDFDNRFPAEFLDKAHSCQGCSAVHPATRGSNWTDLSLSSSAPDVNWPDEDGPAVPNNAVFVFDFTVKDGDIPPGSNIFFNMVFGDYDIDPAVIQVEFAKEPARRLQIRNQGRKDGLIQARTAFLKFEEIFTRDADGNWRGFAGVEFFAPFEPYTAFDYVELSIFQIADKMRHNGPRVYELARARLQENRK